MVTFIHCADLHLGKKFARVADENKLVSFHDARLGVLASLRQLAKDRGAEFVLVAGDLFDGHGVESALVTRVCAILNEFEVPVYILPGNHDHYDAAGKGVYESARWRPAAHVFVLSTPEVVPALDGRVLLYPARARIRREADPCSWFTDTPRRDETGSAVRIGVAHGSMANFAAEGAQADSQTILKPAEIVEDGQLDYLALGDWHSARNLQQHERAWYSGAAEPDRFDLPNGGAALVVTVDHVGAVPRVEAVPVARVRWLNALPTAGEVLDSREALALWRAELNALPRETCLDLTVRGSLAAEDYRALVEEVERASELLLWAEINYDRVVDESQAATLDELASRDPLVGRVIEELRELEASGAQEPGVVTEALRQLLRHVSGEVN